MKSYNIEKVYNKAHCKVFALSEPIEMSDEKLFGENVGVFSLAGKLKYTAKLSRLNGDEIWIPVASYVDIEEGDTIGPLQTNIVREAKARMPKVKEDEIDHSPKFPGTVNEEMTPERKTASLTTALANSTEPWSDRLVAEKIVANAFPEVPEETIARIGRLFRSIDTTISQLVKPS